MPPRKNPSKSASQRVGCRGTGVAILFIVGLFGLWINTVVEYDKFCVQTRWPQISYCHFPCQDGNGYLWFLGSQEEERTVPGGEGRGKAAS